MQGFEGPGGKRKQACRYTSPAPPEKKHEQLPDIQTMMQCIPKFRSLQELPNFSNDHPNTSRCEGHQKQRLGTSPWLRPKQTPPNPCLITFPELGPESGISRRGPHSYLAQSASPTMTVPNYCHHLDRRLLYPLLRAVPEYQSLLVSRKEPPLATIVLKGSCGGGRRLSSSMCQAWTGRGHTPNLT